MASSISSKAAPLTDKNEPLHQERQRFTSLAIRIYAPALVARI